MPSYEHETLIEVFRDQPALLAVLAKLLALDEGAQPQVVESKLADLDPAEHSADLVLHYPGSQPRAVVLEVQRSQDADKRFTWPHYLSGVRLRLRCDVALVVVATTKEVARWCAKPIDSGHPGHRLKPVVIGPRQVPVVSQPEQAHRYPELLVLSAIMHGKGPRGERIARAAAPVLALFEPHKAPRYFDLITSSLNELARAILEREMSDYYQFQTEWLRSAQEKGIRQGREEGRLEGRLEGRTEGLAEAVLKVLARRGIAVPSARAEQIRGASGDQLDRWLECAVTATSLDDIFSEPELQRS